MVLIDVAERTGNRNNLGVKIFSIEMHPGKKNKGVGATKFHFLPISVKKSLAYTHDFGLESVTDVWEGVRLLEIIGWI